MKTPTKEEYDEGLQGLYFLGGVILWMAKRAWGLKLMHRMMFAPAVGTKIDGFANDEIEIPSTTSADHSIRIRVYKPENVSGPLPALLYVHGGGYQVGVPEQAHDFFADLMRTRNVAIIAPAYRLSLANNSPYPHGLNDCYDTIKYMKDHASELGIMDSKYVIAGHSGGGGLATALTLKVVDTKAVDLSFFMPIYPMLDHRMQTESAREFVGTLVWDRQTNADAWERYLGHLSPDEITDYASPALREDLRNLPPAISFVGTLEPFLDEVKIFMEALKAAGVATKFKIFKGAFHGFELGVATAPISIEANNFQINSFAEFYDKYILG